MFPHSRDPHPAIKLWCQVPFTKSKTTFQIEMYCMQCFLKSKYIKSRTFNDKNRWVIKKVMVFKKLLQHLAIRGTYSPGDWRCDEAWREQTLVYPPVMCQQRLIYCTWALNVMTKCHGCVLPATLILEDLFLIRKIIKPYDRHICPQGEFYNIVMFNTS